VGRTGQARSGARARSAPGVRPRTRRPTARAVRLAATAATDIVTGSHPNRHQVAADDGGHHRGAPL